MSEKKTNSKVGPAYQARAARIGEVVAEIAAEHPESVLQIMGRAEVTRMTYYNLIGGTYDFHITTLLAVCDALGVSAEYVMWRAGERGVAARSTEELDPARGGV